MLPLNFRFLYCFISLIFYFSVFIISLIFYFSFTIISLFYYYLSLYLSTTISIYHSINRYCIAADLGAGLVLSLIILPGPGCFSAAAAG